MTRLTGEKGNRAMSIESRSKNLPDRFVEDLAQVVYDPGVCFAAFYDFVTYLADLRNKEFYYVYERVPTGQERRVRVQQLRPEDIDTIRENLGGGRMADRLEELRAYERRTEGAHLFACDYRPEELHLRFEDGGKFSVKIDQAGERLPEQLEVVANPFGSLPPEFFPSREEMYPRVTRF